MRDLKGRNINYMRISITDRCNLRCRYCMPEEIEQIPMDGILTYEEIEAVIKAAAELGISKIKITGGEPLVRKDCWKLISGIKQIPGIEQVTMTTNGILLGSYLNELINAGLDAVNVSLDSMNREIFKNITGFDKLDNVLDNIEMALASGLKVKVNSLIQRGVNDHEILSLAGLAENKNLDVRFIEMMPIGYADVSKGMSNGEVLSVISAKYPGIQTDDSYHGNGPAVYYQVPGFKGGIGFISAIHGKFCNSCNRIRMTARGYIKPCLCYGEGIDLFETIRDNKPDKEERILGILRKAINMKQEGHCFEEQGKISENRKMIQIGG